MRGVFRSNLVVRRAKKHLSFSVGRVNVHNWGIRSCLRGPFRLVLGLRVPGEIRHYFLSDNNGQRRLTDHGEDAFTTSRSRV